MCGTFRYSYFLVLIQIQIQSLLVVLANHSMAFLVAVVKCNRPTAYTPKHTHSILIGGRPLILFGVLDRGLPACQKTKKQGFMGSLTNTGEGGTF